MRKINIILIALSVLLINYRSAIANDQIFSQISKAVKFSVLSIVKGNIKLTKKISQSVGSVSSIGNTVSDNIFGTGAAGSTVKKNYNVIGKFSGTNITFIQATTSGTNNRIGGNIDIFDSRISSKRNRKFKIKNGSISNLTIGFGFPCIDSSATSAEDVSSSDFTNNTSCAIPLSVSKVIATRKGNKIKLKGKLKNSSENASGRFNFTLKAK